jgi:hypothetical protein
VQEVLKIAAKKMRVPNLSVQGRSRSRLEAGYRPPGRTVARP